MSNQPNISIETAKEKAKYYKYWVIRDPNTTLLAEAYSPKKNQSDEEASQTATNFDESIDYFANPEMFPFLKIRFSGRRADASNQPEYIIILNEEIAKTLQGAGGKKKKVFQLGDNSFVMEQSPESDNNNLIQNLQVLFNQQLSNLENKFEAKIERQNMENEFKLKETVMLMQFEYAKKNLEDLEAKVKQREEELLKKENEVLDKENQQLSGYNKYKKLGTWLGEVAIESLEKYVDKNYLGGSLGSADRETEDKTETTQEKTTQEKRESRFKVKSTTKTETPDKEKSNLDISEFSPEEAERIKKLIQSCKEDKDLIAHLEEASQEEEEETN
ncbi:MAG: hypothetical protein MUC49_14775 [Raineya sp.]|jgi:hypothetical protein|nr:hypothetical protein [Raineya sp.]